jgi:hypothetical protein
MPKSRSKRRHKRNQKPKRFEGLKRKLEQGPFRGQKTVIAPSGQARMSDVLADFVEPYRELADTEEAHRKLLTLAVMAWNAALLPEKEQHAMVDRVLDEGLPTATPELKIGLKEIVHRLMARKKAYFSENKRTIIDFELTDTGRGYHLAVASTLEETSP